MTDVGEWVVHKDGWVLRFGFLFSSKWHLVNEYSGLRVDGTDPKRWFIWNTI